MKRYAIPQIQRYELARRISLFLVGKGLTISDTWVGHLTKKEQIEEFGFYIGKGKIEVNGQKDYVAMAVKVAFGQEYDDVFFASAQTGWMSCEAKRQAPIQELNLYSSFDHYAEVAL